MKRRFEVTRFKCIKKIPRRKQRKCIDFLRVRYLETLKKNYKLLINNNTFVFLQRRNTVLIQVYPCLPLCSRKLLISIEITRFFFSIFDEFSNVRVFSPDLSITLVGVLTVNIYIYKINKALFPYIVLFAFMCSMDT